MLSGVESNSPRFGLSEVAILMFLRNEKPNDLSKEMDMCGYKGECLMALVHLIPVYCIRVIKDQSCNREGHGMEEAAHFLGKAVR